MWITNKFDRGNWETVPGYIEIVGAGQTASITEPAGTTGAFYRAKVRLLPSGEFVIDLQQVIGD